MSFIVCFRASKANSLFSGVFCICSQECIYKYRHMYIVSNIPCSPVRRASHCPGHGFLMETRSIQLQGKQTSTGPTQTGVQAAKGFRGCNAHSCNRVNQCLRYLGQNGLGILGDLKGGTSHNICLLYTSPSPRDRQKSRMPSSA